MARNQKNFEHFLYVDDNTVSWTKRGELGGAATAVDGHASGTNAPTWIDTKRMRVRKIIYQDPVTFRQVDPIFYTAAAFSAPSSPRIESANEAPPPIASAAPASMPTPPIARETELPSMPEAEPAQRDQKGR